MTIPLKSCCSPVNFSQISSKALNGVQWEVAQPLPLNYGVPIAFSDEMGVPSHMVASLEVIEAL